MKLSDLRLCGPGPADEDGKASVHRRFTGMLGAMNDQAAWTTRFEQSFTGPASAVRARIWQQV
jgi:hypothetical protein